MTTDRRPMLGLVPARAGSKGVVGKNMRLLARRPLIQHTLEAARAAGVFDRLVVSTDGTEIESWCRLHGYEVVMRPAELADDAATISQVTLHVVEQLGWTGGVAVMLPTSPMRGAASIQRAVGRFHDEGLDSLATVVREKHLFWFDESDDLSDPRPLHTERRNRQFATHGVLREVGAVGIIDTEALARSGEMIGERHALMELSEDEAIDIDTLDDLYAARRVAERGRIVFRLRANREVGSAHLFNCLVLAEELAEHDLHFLLWKCDPFVSEALDRLGYAWSSAGDLVADLTRLKVEDGPTLLVNDLLDTDEAGVLMAKALGYIVVNVNDLGPGAKYADLVINPLYPGNLEDGTRVVSGAPWTQVRREFHNVPPKIVREVPERVLLVFGGTDPAHFSERFATALHAADLGVHLKVLLGPGAADQTFPPGVEAARRTPSMAAEMLEADIAVTAAGRTVYEAAMTGTPVVTVAANAREATHAHLNPTTGVVHLGLGAFVDDDHLVSVVRRMLGDHSLRRELSNRLRRSVNALGAERIANRIHCLIRGL